MMKLNYLQMRAFQKALEIVNDSLNVRISTLTSDFDEENPIIFGVNWCCQGISTYQDAEQYGKNLIKAAGIAQGLNSLEMIYTYEGINDAKDTFSQELFDKNVGRIVHEFEFFDPEYIEYIRVAIIKAGK